MDPVTKLLLALDVGDRTVAMAQGVVHQVAQVLAPGCVPLFLTDGFKEYTTALLTHYGSWVQPLRRQATGPAPKPRWIPLPGLLYAQVIKTVRRRRLVRVRHRVVFGTLEAVQQVLAACGWQINTAFIERLNLSIRQHVAAVGRRVTTLCKGEDGLHQQLALYHVYHNFCLLHGLAKALRHSGDQWSPSCHRASAPATRSRFLASPARPPVPPVSRLTRTHPNRPGARHPASCPRGDGRARWRPRSISARLRPVRIRAGWGSAISAPTVTPTVAPGASCIAPAVAATSRRPTARRCMASVWCPSGWCGRWAPWREGWAFVPSPACSKS